MRLLLLLLFVLSMVLSGCATKVIQPKETPKVGAVGDISKRSQEFQAHIAKLQKDVQNAKTKTELLDANLKLLKALQNE